MKRIIALLLAAIFSTALFGGCGQTPSISTPTENSAGGEGDGEEVVIEYWQYYYESKVNLIDELIKEFEAANPGIKVVHQNFPYDNYEQKLAASIATATAAPISSTFSTDGFPSMSNPVCCRSCPPMCLILPR